MCTHSNVWRMHVVGQTDGASRRRIQLHGKAEWAGAAGQGQGGMPLR